MAKLIDILARELKVWPDNNLADFPAKHVAQDNDGMLVTLDPEEKPDVSHLSGGSWSRSRWTGGDLTFEVADDFKTAIITRAEWQAAVDALNAPKVVEWDGVGFPPAGIVCERKEKDLWVKTTIVGRTVENTPATIHQDKDGFIGWTQNESSYRPIRTAEQIADEERNKAIEDMMEVTSDGITCMGRDDALSLYKAGYRKQ